MASKRGNSSVIAFALAFSAAACGGARSGGGQGAKVPLAPAGTYVEDDVAAGFSAYQSILERWGRWSPEARYGVQWCPNHDQIAGYGLPFEPYRTGGHWDTSLEKPVYGAPPGTPYWVSDDSETWGEITMHHGYWVQRRVDPTRGARAADWCWIPGVSPTAARVVWRSGGGFVGWAPEPPSWVDDGGEGLYADFVWSFVMTGALLETLLDEQVLTDDASQIAAETTMPFGGTHEHPIVRIGPQATTVAQAKRDLAAYVRAHPEIPAGSTSAIARATAGSTGASNGASSGNGGSSGSGSGAAGTSGSGPDAKSKAAKKSDDEPMPQASIMVQTMMRDPMVGPIGVTPRFLRPTIAHFEPSTGAALESGGYQASSGSASEGGHESGGHSAFSSIMSAVGHVAAAATSVHSGSSSSSHSSGSSSSHSSSSSSSSSSSHSSGASTSSSTSSHSSARAPK